MKKIILALIIISTVVLAVPALKGEKSFMQADGSTFNGYIKGDEWFHWIEDKQGNIIRYNKQSRNYEYGVLKIVKGELNLMPSGVKVFTQMKKTSINQSLQKIQLEQIDKDILLEIWKSRKSSREKIPHRLNRKIFNQKLQ